MRNRLSGKLQLIDVMTLMFAAVNIAYIVVMRRSIDEPGPLAAGYAACLAVSLLAVAMGGPEASSSDGTGCRAAVRWMRGFVRQCSPFALLAYFFLAVTKFDTAIFGRDIDPVIAAMDRFLFGSVPSAWLMVKFPSFLLSELLHGAYILYYLSIPGLALWLYVRNRQALPEYVASAMFVFYITCLVYAVVPVVGGRFDPAVKAMTEVYRYGPFTRIMAFIYRSSGHMGAAFPSTHAMISLVVALSARRSARPLALPAGINAALVLAATVYCGYHYVVDVLAAIALLAVLYPAGLRLFASFRREPQEGDQYRSDAA